MLQGAKEKDKTVPLIMNEDRPVTTPGYWEKRYQAQDTPWDIGYASPPLIHYLETLNEREQRILIPGAGRAYEAVWLHDKGFRNVFVCDWAPSAFKRLKEKAPDFPESRMLVSDFFGLVGRFDLILEQTFFSALPPKRRLAYAQKVQALLQPAGRLAGLLFAHPFDHQGPPFGGTAAEYEDLFKPYFDILQLQVAEDSIAPRAGRELLIEMRALPS